MVKRISIKALASAGLALIVLAIPQTAWADQTIASVPAPTPVSAFGGRLAWSDHDPATGNYRLMTEVGGTISPVPVATRKVPFDVDLGPNESGNTVAVYSRCRREPGRPDPAISNAIVQLPDWETGRGCDVYEFDFATGREAKVAGASTRGASEFLPTVWKGRIAFARVYERRPGRAGDRAYLYVRSLTGGRSLRVPAGIRSKQRFCSGKPRRCRLLLEPGPTALDLAGRRLAFGWDSGGSGGPFSNLYLATIGSKTVGKRLVARQSSGDIQAAEIVSPAITDGKIVWTLTQFGDDTSNLSLRYPISNRDVTEAPLGTPGPADAFIRPVIAGAVDGDTVYYLASGLTPPGEPCTPQNRCIASPGCSATQPCLLRSATSLPYARSATRDSG
jgi:hypothetical protein